MLIFRSFSLGTECVVCSQCVCGVSVFLGNNKTQRLRDGIQQEVTFTDDRRLRKIGRKWRRLPFGTGVSEQALHTERVELV